MPSRYWLSEESRTYRPRTELAADSLCLRPRSTFSAQSDPHHRGFRRVQGEGQRIDPIHPLPIHETTHIPTRRFHGSWQGAAETLLTLRVSIMYNPAPEAWSLIYICWRVFVRIRDCVHARSYYSTSALFLYLEGFCWCLVLFWISIRFQYWYGSRKWL